MIDTQLFTALSNFGALGILVAFLIWRDHCTARDRLVMEKEHAAQKLKMEERKLTMEERKMTQDRDRLNADKELTTVLATLTATIQARWNG